MNYIDEIANHISLEAEGELPTTYLPLYRLYALLCMVKGDETSPADVHDAWSVFTLEQGNTDHPYVVPFDELAPEVQELDRQFCDAIQVVAEVRKGNEGEIVR